MTTEWRITEGGRERVKKTSAVLAQAFRTDPAIIYLLNSLPDSERSEYMHKYFHVLFTAAALNHGIFMETDDWTSCGILLPPGRRVDNPWTMLPAGILGVLLKLGWGGVRKIIVEISPRTAAAKRKVFPTSRSRYYYLFFLGTLESGRGKGLGSAIVRHCQEAAAKDRLPLWLEASSESSMQLYLKLGFEIVEKIVVGKGKAGADGLKEDGGEGVPIWAMIWRPKEEKD